MSEREDFVASLQAVYAVMEENEEAFLAYVKARDEASSAFCAYSNKHGFRDALKAKQEAMEAVSS